MKRFALAILIIIVVSFAFMFSINNQIIVEFNYLLARAYLPLVQVVSLSIFLGFLLGIGVTFKLQQKPQSTKTK